MATPTGIKKHAAIVFIPVRSVTVAEPPKMSMEETMMFVAKLKKTSVENETLWNLLKEVVPEEHENEMSEFSPTSADDLEPGVSVRGIKLKLGRKLVGHVRSS